MDFFDDNEHGNAFYEPLLKGCVRRQEIVLVIHVAAFVNGFFEALIWKHCVGSGVSGEYEHVMSSRSSMGSLEYAWSEKDFQKVLWVMYSRLYSLSHGFSSHSLTSITLNAQPGYFGFGCFVMGSADR